MAFWKKKDKDKTKSTGDGHGSSNKSKKIKDLWEACEVGDAASLEYIFKKKGVFNCLNSVNQDGRYPIHVATSSGNIEAVQFLLKSGAQCNMIENTEARWNVLHCATNSKNIQMVSLIVSESTLKADYRGPAGMGGSSSMDRNSPLHYFCSNFSENPSNIINLMIQGKVADHFCVRILQKGCKVDASNSQGETPLHRSCYSGHVEIAKALLNLGASPNNQNENGETPLHFAAKIGSHELVQILLTHGAKKNIAGAFGYPYDLATTDKCKKLLSIQQSSSSSSSSAALPAVQQPPPQPQHHSENSKPTSSTSSSYITTSPLSHKPHPTSPSTSDSNIHTSRSNSTIGTASSPSTALTASSSSITTTPRTHGNDSNHSPTNSSSSSFLSTSIQSRHYGIVFSEIQFGPKIGSGGFGEVYRGSWRGIDVAIKKLYIMGQINPESIEVFMHEIIVMSRLRHQNILLLVGACFEPDHLCLLTEFIPHGSLREVLKKERLPPIKRITMAMEATKGLMYLHSQSPPILHRDLKTDNLLVDDSYHIKVADFGLSRPDGAWNPGGNKSTTGLNPSSSIAKPTVNSTASNNHEHNDHNNHPIQGNGMSGSSSGHSLLAGNTTAINPDKTNTNSDNNYHSDSSLPTDTVSKESMTEEEGRLVGAGTLYITAPEVLAQHPYSQKSDIYSLGLILWELASEKVPYEGLSSMQLVRAIEESSLPISDSMGSDFAALVKSCLSKDPESRPKLEEVFEQLKSIKSRFGNYRA